MASRSRRSARPTAWPIAGGRITVALVIGRLTEGAPQRQLAALARQLDPRRHTVRVYCLSELTTPHGPALEAAGCVVVTVPGGTRDTRRVVTLARAFRRDGVDVVHAFGWSAAVYASVAARLARIVTIVLSVSGSTAMRIGPTRYLRGDAARRATAVLAASHAEASRLHEAVGVAPARVRVVYDGVPLAQFPAPTRLDEWRDRVRGGRTVILASAPWISEDARSLVEQAAARVLEDRPDARFVWCAPREHATVLGELSVRHQLAATVVSDADGRARELGRATVLWAIGNERPVLTSIVEAMAAGRAIVATRHVDSERILVDGAGLLVDAGDPTALAARTVELAQNGSRRREIGHAAHARAEQCFSVVEMARAVAAVYQQALLGLIDGEPAALSADAPIVTGPVLVKDR